MVKQRPLSSKKKRVIVTAALPYANGPIHIGHLLEYIQADIYSRFLKMQGQDALFICASDMHGTPIEVNAKKEGVKPEVLVEKFWKEHQDDFASFQIHFDNYYKTHSPENKELAEFFFDRLRKKKYIYTKKINVIYCPSCARTLPDRYVKGSCPYCSTADQYGDVCESCGTVLKSTDLINPKCTLCGSVPMQKQSEHYFFTLHKFSARLQKWFKNAHLQPEVKNWLQEWLDKGLEDWCISRDEPYFGFEIPGSVKEVGEKKFFYVWLDAPIGYISSTKHYCDQRKLNWKEYWYKGNVQHHIGKDIAYFHFLFWPAMLMAMKIPLPDLTVHGFITVNGQKMSKSRGTFMTAKDFLKLYPPEALRFFYATHLDRKVVDVDLNIDDFIAVNNNVLMGSIGNFCYRVLTFGQKNYGEVKSIAVEKTLKIQIKQLLKSVKEGYENHDFKHAMKALMSIADLGNTYFQKSEVWKDKESAESKKVVGFCVNIARNLAIGLQPVLPSLTEKVRKALADETYTWKDLDFGWKGKLHPVEMMVQKIEKVPESSVFPLHLRVGEIKEVKNHPNADSLYVMNIYLGKELGIRQVVAGIRKLFSHAQLVGKKVVFCVNVKPAVIRGEKSEAMVLVAEDENGASLLDIIKSDVGEEVKVAGMKNNHEQILFDDFKKLTLLVKDGHIEFEGKKLVTDKEAVRVEGRETGAKVL
ncbi:TPA: methionine--tRNA ligase [Candidatus Woesearchaeota archaeon]|nr:methionine--tRNA ligase [Candidatus Woesearchaeota archaeon]